MPAPWVAQSGESRVDRSACRSPTSLLCSLATLRDLGLGARTGRVTCAEQICCHHPRFNPGLGDRKDPFRWGREKRCLWGLESVLLVPGPTGIYLQMSAAIPALGKSKPHLENARETSHSLLVLGYRESQRVCRPPGEEDPEGWGSCTHLALLGSKQSTQEAGGRFALWGQRPFRLPGCREAGAGRVAHSLGLPASCKLRRLARAAWEGAGERSTQAGRQRSPSRTPITFL